MARLPYSNFHDLNLDFVLKVIKKAFTPDNPPPYPVKSVNGLTGNVTVTGDIIPLAPNNSEKVTDAIRGKQTAPAAPGNPGQVLGLDANQTPVWMNQTGGVTSYDELTGKPSINGVPLSGEMEGTDLGLIDAPSVPGTAGQVLTSDGQGGQSWQTPATPSGLYAPIITDTASGNPASFPDGIANMPMSVIASIVPVQDLHGYANPWPAGGGKNKLPVGETETINGVTFTVNSDGSVSVSGTATANAGYDIGRSLLTLPAGTYYASSHATTTNVTYTVYKVVSGTASVVRNGVGSFTLTEDTSIFVRLSVTNGNTASGTAFPMIESGSAETDYAPYSNICPISGHAGLTLYTSGPDTSNPDVFPFAWGDVAGRVYGGNLTVNDDGSCRLTIDKVMWTKNTSTMNNGENLPGWRQAGIAELIGTGYNNMFDATMNIGTKYNANTRNNNDILFLDMLVYGKTQTEWQALAIDIQIVVALANPIVYDLPPINTLRSLFGTNTVWTDVGPVSVDYYADTKLFILKVIQ